MINLDERKSHDEYVKENKMVWLIINYENFIACKWWSLLLISKLKVLGWEIQGLLPKEESQRPGP